MNIKPEQREFLNWEMGVFFHFGIRSFNESNRDWDGKYMELNSFDPTALDCEDWISAAYEAGAKYAILVCKHHDGFANWPSAYTEYSVKNTPWKNGKGDVVREFVDACRKYGLKVGLYYSPAQFGSVDMDSREYDDYFINQISELLGNYGKIDYLWFDGCGSENHKYDTKRIIASIRALQPQILIFNMWDPDTRWIGNESGLAHSPNNLFVNEVDFSVLTEDKDALGEKKFLPAECDFRMRHVSWFYNESEANDIKSPDELMGLYLYSVGRGANFLINIGPDRRGLLPDNEKASLLEFGKRVKRLYDSEVPSSSVSEDMKLTLTTDRHTLINHVILTEEIEESGEIESFEIKIYPFPYGAPVTVYRGTTIGHKAIAVFPTVRTQKVEITFDKPKKIGAKLYYVPSN